MIVVDDGSSDSTFDLASSHAEVDSRIKVLIHEGGQNRGVSASRNLAIDAARGTYLAFLDADDVWLPTKLEEQIAVLDSSRDVAITFAKAQCIGADGKFVRHPDWPNIEWVLGHAPEAGVVEAPFGAFVSARIGIPMPTVTARRQAVIDAGKFPLGLRYQVEDSALWGTMCRRSKLHFEDKVLALYRVHQENFSSSLDPIETIDAFWELCTLLLEETESPEPELVTTMVSCVDRYLTAWGIPIGIRWRRAVSRAAFLSEHGIVSQARVKSRFLAAPPIGLKKRMMVFIRRLLGIGPLPWKAWMRP
jgi:glycosyltransferase involved in cell wall biosynthesis